MYVSLKNHINNTSERFSNPQIGIFCSAKVTTGKSLGKPDI